VATISLEKGQKISLDKEAPGLKKIIVGLGWKERSTEGIDFDLDASAFMLNAQNRVANDHHFIFYHPSFQSDASGSVKHSGDNLSGGQSDDDCEQIEIDLETVPESVKKIVIAVTIYKARERGQNFGQVKDAYARIVNQSTGETVARYNLTETYSTETALEVLELYRHNGEWRIGAIGAGYSNGLAGIAGSYGLDVDGG
jgi:tellurium resistance protein TerD